MAALAIARGKRRARRSVRRICGVLPVLQMAGITSRRKPQKLSRGRLLVALFTLYGRMRAQQWKAVLVIAHRLRRDVPTLHSVALRTVRPHLSAVNVRVAIRAILADVCKNRLHVALHAFHFLVHPAQRVSRLVVVEFRHCADRTPTRRRMAVFARNV